MLMGLYVWYYGKNLTENWGVRKSVIKTDEELDEVIKDFTATEVISTDIEDFYDDTSVKSQSNKFIKEAKQAIGKTYAEFEAEQQAADQAALNKYLNSKVGREAYAKTNNLDLKDLEEQYSGFVTIPLEVFKNFYNNDTR